MIKQSIFFAKTEITMLVISSCFLVFSIDDGWLQISVGVNTFFILLALILSTLREIRSSHNSFLILEVETVLFSVNLERVKLKYKVELLEKQIRETHGNTQ